MPSSKLIRRFGEPVRKKIETVDLRTVLFRSTLAPNELDVLPSNHTHAVLLAGMRLELPVLRSPDNIELKAGFNCVTLWRVAAKVGGTESGGQRPGVSTTHMLVERPCKRPLAPFPPFR
jgi:hypothetical protein